MLYEVITVSLSGLADSPRDLNRETCIGEAFLDNKTKIENDCDYLDKPEASNIVFLEGFKSFAHAPISIEGQPIGVLSCFSRTAKGIFTEEFIELFNSLAGQIGVAWRNSRQTEDLIKAREQERELQIAKTIQLVITSYSIHYTKLYENRRSRSSSLFE